MEYLYVCVSCGKSEWLPIAYLAETHDADQCYCESGYGPNPQQMKLVSKRTWNVNEYVYDEEARGGE